MPDPQVQKFSDYYAGLADPEEKKAFKRRWAEGVMGTGPGASSVLLEASEAIGEDMTSFWTPSASLPINTEQVKQNISEKTAKVGVWRRAAARAAGAVEWYTNTVQEPVAAAALNAAYSLTSKEEELSVNMGKAKARMEAERVLEGRSNSLLEGIRLNARASTESYRNTDMPWGVKGFVETATDPLNFLGLGIPGKLLKTFPAMQPILFPLKLADELPGKAVAGGFKLTGAVAKRTPVLGTLLKPHYGTEVRQVKNRVYESLADTFGPVRLNSGSPIDTMDVLGDLSKYPQDAGPYSLLNVMNHIGGNLTRNQWDEFATNLKKFTPLQATQVISDMAVFYEKQAYRYGIKEGVSTGVRLGGEVVEKGEMARRLDSNTALFQRLSLDETHARAVAETIDKYVYGPIDRIYLAKIEPMLVKPWALSHLAFAGFGPFNLLEDFIMKTLGMNDLGKLTVNADEFIIHTAGLPVPGYLRKDPGAPESIVELMTGAYQYDKTPTTVPGKIANELMEWQFRKAGRAGIELRRAAWMNTFWKEMYKSAEKAGVPRSKLEYYRKLIDAEFPAGFDDTAKQDITTRLWAGIAGGDAEALKHIKKSVTSDTMLRKMQASLVADLPNLPPAAREVLYQQIWALEGGTITAANRQAVRALTLEKVLDWNKFHPASVQAQYGNFIGALAIKAPSGPQETAALLRMLQHAGDTLDGLPREIMAHYRHRAETVPFYKRKAVWEEAHANVAESLTVLRGMYNDALDRARPYMDTMLVRADTPAATKESVRRSIDSIFAAYKEMGDNIARTWETHRAQRRAYFDQPVPHDDAFWQGLAKMDEPLWEGERLFRAEQSNIARTGWNNLLDIMPGDLGPNDRTFMVAGIRSARNNAEVNLNDIRVDLADAEVVLPTLPASQQALETQKIARMKTAATVAATHLKFLDERLSRYSATRAAKLPQQVLEHEHNIKTHRKALALAQKHDPSQVELWETSMNQAIESRDLAFEQSLSPHVRKDWQGINQRIADLKTKWSQVGRATEQTAIQKELKKAEFVKTRFRTVVQRGDTWSGVEGAAGVSRRLLATAAEEVWSALGNRMPNTVDELQAVVDNLALQGNPNMTQLAMQVAAADAPAQQEVFDRLFGAVAEHSQLGQMPPARIATLRQAALGKDAFPTEHMVALVSEGYLEAPTRLRDGRWRNTLTPKGMEFMEGVSPKPIPVGHIRLYRGVGGRQGQLSDPQLRGMWFSRSRVHAQTYGNEISYVDVPADVAGKLKKDMDELDVASGAMTRDPNTLIVTPEIAAQAISDVTPNIDPGSILDDLDPPVRGHPTIIDDVMSQVDDTLNKAVGVSDNPPMRPGQDAEIGSYIDRISAEVGKDTDLLAKLKVARLEAAEKTTPIHNAAFINYDDRSTLDIFMTHLMPFWMYESRRWPRLIKLAAAHPVLAKHYTVAATDWDFGYMPTPWGDEFNPGRGLMSTGLRKLSPRDYPEYHNDWRGNLEKGLDWVGIGGFYFAPPVTAAANLLGGEPASSLPPPLSLAIHGAAAAGVQLPFGIKQLAFSSRFMDYLVDQVIANEFKTNPKDVRRMMKDGNDDAQAMYAVAERKAAAVQVRMSQTGVLRYRPESKREFMKDAEAALEILGLSEEDLKTMQRLGLSPAEVIPISRFQRKAMREMIKGYDAWAGASVSLRPREEQAAIFTNDEFWTAMATVQEEFETQANTISARWEGGQLSGAEARKEYTKLQNERGAVFDFIKNQDKFKDVPISIEKRLAYAQRWGHPPALTSPVDELMEMYYSVKPESYTNPLDGEVEWAKFFARREEVLAAAPEDIVRVFRDATRRTDTAFETELQIAAPYIRAYYGIRSEIMATLGPTEQMAFQEYNKLVNLSRLPGDERTRRYYADQAINMSASLPSVRRAQTQVRAAQEEARKNPQMQRVYEMFMSRPTLPAARRRSMAAPMAPRR